LRQTDIFPIDFMKQHHYYLSRTFTIFKVGIRSDTGIGVYYTGKSISVIF